jgi:tetratricopeptide (TPR) repeat protein
MGEVQPTAAASTPRGHSRRPFPIVTLGLVCACCLWLVRLGFPRQYSEPAPSSPVRSDDTFLRIEALVSSRQFDAAERLFQQDLSAGNAASAYLRLGGIYFDHEEWSRAAAALQKSLGFNDHSDRAHLLLGLTWRELEKPGDAEAELQKAVQDDPRSETNAYLAGHQLMIDEKYEAALPYLYKAVELNSADPRALRALGMAQARMGSYGLAESYYRKAAVAAGATPDGAAAYSDLAFLLLLGNDPGKAEDALRCAQTAAKLNPSLPGAHYLAGKALFKLGRLPQAVEELREAEKLNPDDSKPHFLLAQAYDRLGEQQKADAERKALALSKSHAPTAGAAGGSSLPADSK